MLKKDLYLAIKNAIKVKIPSAFIDLQKGQFLKPTEDIPVPLPAALIEITDINWKEYSSKAQEGNGQFKIDLYLPIVQNTFDESEAEDDTLNMLDANNDVFTSVNGLNGTGFSYIERISEGKPKYDKEYVCFETIFKVKLIENYV